MSLFQHCAAESAMEKALHQSLAAADASEAANPCKAPVVEVSLRSTDEALPKHAGGQAKLGKPPVMVGISTHMQSFN